MGFTSGSADVITRHVLRSTVASEKDRFQLVQTCTMSGREKIPHMTVVDAK